MPLWDTAIVITVRQSANLRFPEWDFKALVEGGIIAQPLDAFGEFESMTIFPISADTDGSLTFASLS
jgi:hypothetical protein